MTYIRVRCEAFKSAWKAGKKQYRKRVTELSKGHPAGLSPAPSGTSSASDLA